MLRRLILGLFFCTNCFVSICQEEIMDIVITDTSFFNSDSILVFSDGSWEYLEDYHQYYRTIYLSGEGIPLFDSSAVTSYNWNENKTHGPRLIDLSLITDTIQINCSGYYPPVKGSITSGYKMRWGVWHKGIDYEGRTGDTVKCAFNGVVRYAQMNYGGYGNLVIVRHYNGLETYYAHLSEIAVIPGQKINSGEYLGKVGNTGHSTGPHLHFECRILENSFNPILLKSENLELTSKNFLRGNGSTRFKFTDILQTDQEVLMFNQERPRRTGGNF